MVDLPTSIEIGPLTFTIHCDEQSITKARARGSDADIRAEIRYSPTTIVIEPDCSPSQKRLALFHEITHAIKSGGGSYDPVSDREQATIYESTMMLDTLRRNPQLVEFLLERE